MAAGWDPSPSDQPLPPQNGSVFSAFMPGVLDLRWDDPSILAGNAVFTIVGVNIYRSDVSDRGPYYRINEFPVGGTFWRDQTENILVKQVIDWNTGWAIKGDGANTRAWLFRTVHPIVKQVGNGPFETPTAADSPRDVQLYIDGVEIPVHSVFGPAGEVTLINIPTINAVTEKIEDAVLPTASSTVEVFYYAKRNHVLSGLDANVHYRLTTVVIDTTKPSGYRETDLAWCEPLSSLTVERLDYIWKEAIRRNNWILQQGGERVKIFIRRRAGIPCTCKMDPETLEYQGQPSNRCETCFPPGTEITLADFTRKLIENIQIGDEVLTHTGKVRRVSETMSREVNEPLVGIQATHGVGFTSTKNHPVLVVRRADARCQRLKNSVCTGPGSKKICSCKPWAQSCVYDVLEKLQWVLADTVKEGDYLVFHHPQSEVMSVSMSRDQLRVLGYYAAEGWTQKMLDIRSKRLRAGWAVVVGQFTLYPVRKVQQVPYSGRVYNLEVEEDHTYVANGAVVHNCFGTGFLGGYEGPFDNLIAPDDAERRISQTVGGRRKEHTYEVWTGPSPVVTQRDFIVKQTNERYSIGPVRRPTNRGNLLQQHFQIGYLDEQDIRYKVVIPSYASLVFPQTRWAFREAPHIAVDGTGYRQPSTMPTEPPYPEGAEGRWPEQTEKAGEPDATQQRGRSGPWENIEYAFLPIIFLPLWEVLHGIFGAL